MNGCGRAGRPGPYQAEVLLGITAAPLGASALGQSAAPPLAILSGSSQGCAWLGALRVAARGFDRRRPPVLRGSRRRGSSAKAAGGPLGELDCLDSASWANSIAALTADRLAAISACAAEILAIASSERSARRINKA
jgi:hypothetical protein